MDISSFLLKWKQSGASERANKDSFLRDLCDVLGVPHPDPKTGDSERDRYVFERDAMLVHGGERHAFLRTDRTRAKRSRPVDAALEAKTKWIAIAPPPVKEK